MKRLALAIVLMLSMMLVISGCNGNQGSVSTPADVQPPKREITVVLDWTPNTNHTGLYVAQELNFYAEAGLEVKLVQPPENGALSLLASGKAQFGISFQEEIASALSGSTPLPVVAVASIIDHNLSGLISLKSTGIEHPKDLEGKRYASWDTPLEVAIIDSIISEDGGDASKLQYIANTATDTFSALNTDMDVVWIFYAWDGIAAEVKEVDFNYLEFRELNPVFDYYTPVIASSENFVDENQELTKAFLAATRKGYEYAIDHPQEAAEILLKAVPELDADIVRASQKYLAEHYRGEKETWGTIDPERWDAFYSWLYSEGLTESDLSGRGFSNEYLR